jgi:8-oxo-dGTP diphosphatase
MNHSHPYVLCSTLYVMNEKREFLLFKHPKLKKWVPPGGKINPGEMPQDAAQRECYEETGVYAEILGAPSPLNNGLISPQGLEYNPPQNGFGSHLDFIYFGRVIKQSHEGVREGDILWLSLSDVGQLDTFSSIFKWCEMFSEMSLRR